MDVTDQLAHLDLYEADEPPVYRSGGGNAYTAWASVGVPTRAPPDSASAPATQKAPEKIVTRCTLPDAWVDDWNDNDAASYLTQSPNCDFDMDSHGDAPPLALAVDLVPHRVEPSGDRLICKLRTFGVTVHLIDPRTGDPASPDTFEPLHLRPTLVFADDGSAVPPTDGEAPLSGEIAPKRAEPTGVCHFKLRATAISFAHAKRLFSVRIDADGAAEPLFACSLPVSSRGRLPDQKVQAPAPAPAPMAVSAAAPPPAVPTAMAAAAAVVRPAVTTSCIMVPSPAAPSGAHPPAEPTVECPEWPAAAEWARSGTDDAGSDDEVGCEEEGACDEARTSAGPTTTLPSAMDLSEDADGLASLPEDSLLSEGATRESLERALYLHTEMLRHALVEQRRMLGEFARLHGSGCPPPPSHLESYEPPALPMC